MYYLLRSFATCNIESDVVITFEFSSYARCATIRFTISSATWTFEDSRYPCLICDFVSAAFVASLSAGPDASVGIYIVPPIL